MEVWSRTTSDMAQQDDTRISCNDGCKDSVKDMDEAMAKAWHYLQITKRYRCVACARALAAINKFDFGTIDQQRLLLDQNYVK